MWSQPFSTMFSPSFIRFPCVRVRVREDSQHPPASKKEVPPYYRPWHSVQSCCGLGSVRRMVLCCVPSIDEIAQSQSMSRVASRLLIL